MANQVSSPCEIEDSTFEAAELSTLEASSSDAASYEEASLSALEASWWDDACCVQARLSVTEATSCDSNELLSLEKATLAEVALRHSLVVLKSPRSDVLGRGALHLERRS